MFLNFNEKSRDNLPDFSFLTKYDNLNHLIETINFKGLNFDVLRLDLINEFWGGNKLFKLIENIKYVVKNNLQGVITFGGANSNHIYSTVALCNKLNIPCVICVRGLQDFATTSTLLFAEKNGAKIYYLNRTDYKNKTSTNFINYLMQLFPNYHLIPEGGNNFLGIKGCETILSTINETYKTIFCACGTATTFTGIYSSLKNEQTLIGISVLKGENKLIDNVNQNLNELKSNKLKINEWNNKSEINHSTILNNYAFNGYAAFNTSLIEFKHNFESLTQIPLDYIYTSKLFYGAIDLMLNKKINSNEKTLIIHCGGLQGNLDFEKRYQLSAKR
ncbi:MAG: pyridoxal-phosphate dependent enzyme [Bacteroidia bacterium]